MPAGTKRSLAYAAPCEMELVFYFIRKARPDEKQLINPKVPLARKKWALAG